MPSSTLPAENKCGPLHDPDLDGKLAQTSHNSYTDKSFLGLYDLRKKIIPVNPRNPRWGKGKSSLEDRQALVTSVPPVLSWWFVHLAFSRLHQVHFGNNFKAKSFDPELKTVGRLTLNITMESSVRPVELPSKAPEKGSLPLTSVSIQQEEESGTFEAQLQNLRYSSC